MLMKMFSSSICTRVIGCSDPRVWPEPGKVTSICGPLSSAPSNRAFISWRVFSMNSFVSLKSLPDAARSSSLIERKSTPFRDSASSPFRPRYLIWTASRSFGVFTA